MFSPMRSSSVTFAPPPWNTDAAVDQHRAGVHLGVADLVGGGLALVRPVGRAGHDLRRPVRERERRQRPDRVQLRLQPAQPGAPRPAIAVDRLGPLPAHDPDHLGEVQLVALAVRQQHGVAHRPHQRIHHQRAAGGGAGDERAGAGRAEPGEPVTPGCGGLDVRHHLAEHLVEQRRRHRLARRSARRHARRSR